MHNLFTAFYLGAQWLSGYMSAQLEIFAAGSSLTVLKQSIIFSHVCFKATIWQTRCLYAVVIRGLSVKSLLVLDTFITPGRRQSKTLFTIDKPGSKIDRNSVFDCHLSPVRRQMTIENSVSNDF